MSAVVLPSEPVGVPSGGVRALLRAIGSPDDFGNPAPDITGALRFTQVGSGREAAVFLRSGRAYGASLSDFVPAIGRRLLSAGLVGADDAVRVEAASGEQLEAVVAGCGVGSDALIDIHRQSILSTVTHLYGWSEVVWVWDDGAVCSDFTIPAMDLALLAASADERLGQWDALMRNFPATTKPHAVPVPGPLWVSGEGEPDTADVVSILSCVDGVATVSEIASACGFTRFEIAARLAKTIADGLLVVPDPDVVLASVPASDELQGQLEDALAELEQARASVEQAQSRVDRIRAAMVEPGSGV